MILFSQGPTQEEMEQMKKQEEEARQKKEAEEKAEKERKDAEEQAMRKKRQEEWVSFGFWSYDNLYDDDVVAPWVVTCM